MQSQFSSSLSSSLSSLCSSVGYSSVFFAAVGLEVAILSFSVPVTLLFCLLPQWVMRTGQLFFFLAAGLGLPQVGFPVS